MSDQIEESGEQARFAAFVETTLADERDCIAFREFEGAIIKATECASMIDCYDGGIEGEREHAALKLALSGMLYRVLPRVDLGVLIASAAGIGYALRYGGWITISVSAGSKPGPRKRRQSAGPVPRAWSKLVAYDSSPSLPMR